ncbi:hypothetical protein N431DRAFT_549608 [Stipitochalara longipes BDJ]|nr:hypothetical protein N431DRAFT_549608 [Stipitochalara longipes BDJ]
MAALTPAGDSSGPRLTSIPLEVLLQITSNLTTLEYGNLRRTCKHIEETLFTSFAREFFTKKQFMFTEFSLQALVDMSKSRLSSCLKHVIFGLERPSMHSYHGQLPSTDPQANTHVQSNRFRQECVDHMSLLYTNQDVEMLAEAFSNLCTLETIGIRDWSSRTRNRDYPHNYWNSYGIRTFELETSRHLERPRRFPHNQSGLLDQADYLSRVFLNLLRSLGKAGSRPKDFEVILRETSLYDHAFNLPKYTDALVQPVLDNLRTLLLDLNAEFGPAYININNTPTECPNYLLITFLSRLPELEHLRLNFRFFRGNETSNLLSWLSKPISAASPNTTQGTTLLESPCPIEFAKLQQLDIGMVTVESKILCGIIQKHRASLRIINLHKVSLLQTDPTKSSRDNLWAKFFGQLSKLDLRLTGMKMSLLSQQSEGRHNLRPITFKDSRDPKAREWGGTDVQSCLRDFVANVVVSGPDQDTESSHSADSVEDDSDDSMHDVNDEDEDDDDDL